jgi:putative membrane protein
MPAFRCGDLITRGSPPYTPHGYIAHTLGGYQGTSQMALLRTLLIVLLMASNAGVASSQSFSERMGINSFLGISPSAQDFVSQVTLNEMFELELARLANERGGEKIKAFADQILKDHKETSAHMRALVQGGRVKVSLPTAVPEECQKELARLTGLAGVDFDKEFESVQARLHKDAISIFERYGSGGDHPDLKQFAYRYLPHLQEHWRLAQNLTR